MIVYYTDGSCEPNPGTGGFAVQCLALTQSLFPIDSVHRLAHCTRHIRASLLRPCYKPFVITTLHMDANEDRKAPRQRVAPSGIFCLRQRREEPEELEHV